MFSTAFSPGVVAWACVGDTLDPDPGGRGRFRSGSRAQRPRSSTSAATRSATRGCATRTRRSRARRGARARGYLRVQQHGREHGRQASSDGRARQRASASVFNWKISTPFLRVEIRRLDREPLSAMLEKRDISRTRAKESAKVYRLLLGGEAGRRTRPRARSPGWRRTASCRWWVNWIDWGGGSASELSVDRPLAARELADVCRFERERDPLRSPRSGRVDAYPEAIPARRQNLSTCAGTPRATNSAIEVQGVALDHRLQLVPLRQQQVVMRPGCRRWAPP